MPARPKSERCMKIWFPFFEFLKKMLHSQHQPTCTDWVVFFNYYAVMFLLILFSFLVCRPPKPPPPCLLFSFCPLLFSHISIYRPSIITSSKISSTSSMALLVLVLLLVPLVLSSKINSFDEHNDASQCHFGASILLTILHPILSI